MIGKAKGKVKGKPKETEGKLRRIQDLPAEWWLKADNGQQGCNYRTEVRIAKVPVVALLGGGSGINSVTEEMLVGMLNKSWADGISTDSKHGR